MAFVYFLWWVGEFLFSQLPIGDWQKDVVLCVATGMSPGGNVPTPGYLPKPPLPLRLPAILLLNHL